MHNITESSSHRGSLVVVRPLIEAANLHGATVLSRRPACEHVPISTGKQRFVGLRMCLAGVPLYPSDLPDLRVSYFFVLHFLNCVDNKFTRNPTFSYFLAHAVDV